MCREAYLPACTLTVPKITKLKRMLEWQRCLSEVQALELKARLQQPRRFEAMLSARQAIVEPEEEDPLPEWCVEFAQDLEEATQEASHAIMKEIEVNIVQGCEDIKDVRKGLPKEQHWAKDLGENNSLAEVLAVGQIILKGDTAVKLYNAFISLRQACLDPAAR